MANARTGGFYRQRDAGVIPSSLRRGLDLTFSMIMLALVAFLVMVAFDTRSGERAAHAWARYLGVHQENDCPTAFGNSFWFNCASEVRRLQATRH